MFKELKKKQETKKKKEKEKKKFLNFKDKQYNENSVILTVIESYSLMIKVAIKSGQAQILEPDLTH